MTTTLTNHLTRPQILAMTALTEATQVDPDANLICRMIDLTMGTHLPRDWSWRWGRAVKTAGSCNYQTRVITLSAPIHRLSTAGDLFGTILHEIAHALVGPGAGHGPRWKQEVVRIGGSDARTHQMVTPPPKWVGICPNGHTVKRERRPSQPVSCSRCGSGYFNPALLLAWTRAGDSAPVPTHLPPAAPLAAHPSAKGLPLVDLRIGQTVVLDTGGRGTGIDGHSAVVTRINRKTATVLVDGTMEWRVSPVFLRRP